MEIFSLPFLRIGLVSSLLAGTSLALLGLFILARRQAFSGLAVSQFATLGSVLCVLMSVHGGAYGAAVVCVLLGMLLLFFVSRNKRTPPEAWVACLYVLGAGLSVLLLSKAPHGEAETLSVFFGNVLSLGATELWESLGIFLVTLVVLGVWFYKWIWISFDPLAAQVSGLSVNRWNFLFICLFAIAMTIAVHIFGVLLAFSYLLLPGTFGLVVSRNLKSLFVTVPLFCLTVTVLGFWCSYHWDFPTAPFLIALMGCSALMAGLIHQLNT